MEDLVRPTMLEMAQRGFSHVPILRRGVVEGVFSVNTVFDCLMEGEALGIDERMRFSDIAAWLPPEKHRSESFRFIREDKLVDEVSAMIEKAQARHDRIGLMFTTRNGRSDEPIIGLLTAWDVAGVRKS
jgi:predicted transcriptional regulator